MGTLHRARIRRRIAAHAGLGCGQRLGLLAAADRVHHSCFLRLHGIRSELARDAVSTR
jgi:predicted sugar kinase